MTPGVGWSAGRRAVVFVFGAYAGFQFMMTHWPKLVVPGPGRPDLVVHFAVFGLWNALLIACARFGPALSWRNITASTVCASLYAGLDEGLQAIPALRRVCAWDDFGANVAGIHLVAVAALLLSMVFREETSHGR